jgi:hypothetical protein
MEARISDETLIRLLPASCRLLLKEGVPLASVMALIRRYGGCVVSMPCAFDESGELARVIGLESALKMVAMHAGDNFYVPRGIRIERHLRDQAILSAYADGRPMAVIARANGVSDRTVTSVIARHGQPKRLGTTPAHKTTGNPTKGQP